MGDDDEQRIQRVMGIFSSPMHATSSNSPPLRISEKNASSPASTAAPICQPWNRADLQRRMATFKSTTWFGKLAPADPVACARKGWVNIGPDLIACEVCRAQLCFPSPPNWHTHQAEQAALNFSKKLSSGHNRNCPWETSITNEELTSFSSSSASQLVDDYRTRMQALSTLSAIPVVSSSAVETMKASREAEMNFLLTSADSMALQITDAAEGEAVQKLQDSQESFTQAQAVISMCGWEPLRLSYSVEQLACRSDPHEPGPNVSVAGVLKGAEPASVVLHCRLCGASVGLWSLNTLNRPSQSANDVLATKRSMDPKFAEPAPFEDVRDNGLANDKDKGSNRDDDSSPSKPVGLDLCLTIAGGPRPTRTHYPPGLFPASLPIPGLFYQYDSEPRKVSEQRGASSKRARSDDDDDSRKKARTEAPEQPSSEAGKSTKRMRTDEDEEPSRKKLKDTEGNASIRRDGVAGCSSVNAVETSCPSKHDNSAESVECSPQQSETLVSQEHDAPHGQDGLGSAQATAKTVLELGALADDAREFHPLSCHRYFCPWIAKKTGEGSCCGWELVVDSLYSDRCPNKAESEKSSLTRMADPLASVRKTLGGKGKDTDKGKSVVVT